MFGGRRRSGIGVALAGKSGHSAAGSAILRFEISDSRNTMDTARPAPSMGFWHTLANIARFLFWLLLITLLLLQVFGGGDVAQKNRDSLLVQFQSERKSRVIAMIHRQQSRSILGVPVSTSIDIEDSESVLRAIRLTPDEQPIDLILHTPGGLVLAAEQIAKALVEHKGKVTVFAPGSRPPASHR